MLKIGGIVRRKNFIIILAVVVFFCGCNKSIITIHEAVRDGDISQVKKLIDAGVDIDMVDSQGYTPLIWAVIKKDLGGIKLLIQSEAKINVKDVRNGMSALHWASYNNDLEIVKVLVKGGANYEIEDNYGQTPCDAAKENEAFAVMKFLEKLY